MSDEAIFFLMEMYIRIYLFFVIKMRIRMLILFVFKFEIQLKFLLFIRVGIYVLSMYTFFVARSRIVPKRVLMSINGITWHAFFMNSPHENFHCYIIEVYPLYVHCAGAQHPSMDILGAIFHKYFTWCTVHRIIYVNKLQAHVNTRNSENCTNFT